MQELQRLAARFRFLGTKEADIFLHQVGLRRLVPSDCGQKEGEDLASWRQLCRIVVIERWLSWCFWCLVSLEPLALKRLRLSRLHVQAVERPAIALPRNGRLPCISTCGNHFRL